MKILKKITSWIAWILIIGGLGVMLYTYLVNKSALVILVSDPAFRTAFEIIRKMLLCALAVFAGMVFLAVSLKLAISIRQKEKRAKIEAEKEAEESEEQ